MEAIICSSPGRLEYKNVEGVRSRPGYSVIRIKRIGVCGTDLHAFEGTQPYFNYPRILGHELAGEYIEGDAMGFHPGEVVTIIPYFYCGTCISCRSGKPNCCTRIEVCGVHCDGGMVEYLSVPSYSLIHGNGLSYDQLALVEPMAIGAHCISRATIAKGEFVLVVGAGPIGLSIMEFARNAGAHVIALDLNEERLHFCRDQLGIASVIHSETEDVHQRLLDISDGDLPTVVIDATGSLTAINHGFSYLAHGGRYILVGLQKGNISFSHPEFHKREATLMSSRNATRRDFEFVIGAIKDHTVNPLAYVTHRVYFHQVKEQFESWLQPSSGVIKAMIEIA